MNEIVYMKNDEAVCDSLQVAEKFEKRHDRVLRAIDNLLGTLPKNGETSKMFILSKRKADDGQRLLTRWRTSSKKNPHRSGLKQEEVENSQEKMKQILSRNWWNMPRNKAVSMQISFI